MIAASSLTESRPATYWLTVYVWYHFCSGRTEMWLTHWQFRLYCSQGCFRMNLLPDIIYESMAPSSADSRWKCCLCSPVYEPVYLSRNAADLIIENDLLTVNKTVCLSNALQWARKICAWLTYVLACFLCVKDNRLWLEACMSNAPCSAELGFFKMHHFTYYITPNTKPVKRMLLFLFSIIGF